eukprot:297133_1
MDFLQTSSPNPLNNRVSLGNMYRNLRLTPTAPKKLPTLRQSITITSGYFATDIMRKIEHQNNLDLHKIQIKKAKIGRGTSAVVHLALYNHREIASKEYKFNDTEFNNMALAEFQNELNILKVLNHSNITQFFGFHLNVHKKVLKFAFEYCPNGSLFDAIHPLFTQPSYQYKHMLQMLTDIANGMKYLHSRNIINRDLKARNVLLFDDYRVKITDFGESVLVDYDTTSFKDYHVYDPVGTTGYTAPEVLAVDQSQGYNYKVDVFSFGSICYEIYTKQFVSGIRYLTRHENLKHNLHLAMVPRECPKGFRQLIIKCWQFKPEKRPDFDAIVDRLNECMMLSVDHGVDDD